MKWQLQREDHNRQDKAKKPDYTEAFADAEDAGNSCGSRNPVRDATSGTLAKKFRADLKIQAATFVEDQLRGALLHVAGYQFRFRMSPSQFANANNLPQQNARRVFRKITEEAERRLAMTKNSVLKAGFDVVILERTFEG